MRIKTGQFVALPSSCAPYRNTDEVSDRTVNYEPTDQIFVPLAPDAHRSYLTCSLGSLTPTYNNIDSGQPDFSARHATR